MSARYDIAALGELLIDFTDSGVSDSGMRLFERNPGGAPANVLTAAARLRVTPATDVKPPPKYTVLLVAAIALTV